MKTLTLLIVAAISLAAYSQQMHHQAVDSRGDHVMGFSHELTTHHFKLYKDGGAIEVTVDDKSDTGQRDAIRTHLKKVAKDFAAGDLTMPMLIHNTNIPGLETMKRLHAKIAYTYAEIPDGGSVRIRTHNTEALKAIHSFLQLQISDHRTGDPGRVEASKSGWITCAVMGNPVNIAEATKKGLYADYNGNRYFFCCGGCPDSFKANPKKFATAPHIKTP